MIPRAYMTHQTVERLRIKVPTKRGDSAYFNHIQDAFAGGGMGLQTKISPSTGGVLFFGEQVEYAAIREFGEEQHLFILHGNGETPKKPVAYYIAEPFHRISRWTLGGLDMPTIAFLTCVGVGIREIIIGKFVTPPWYTAFWYAFGVFSKSMADKADQYRKESAL